MGLLADLKKKQAELDALRKDNQAKAKADLELRMEEGGEVGNRDNMIGVQQALGASPKESTISNIFKGIDAPDFNMPDMPKIPWAKIKKLLKPNNLGDRINEKKGSL